MYKTGLQYLEPELLVVFTCMLQLGVVTVAMETLVKQGFPWKWICHNVSITIIRGRDSVKL